MYTQHTTTLCPMRMSIQSNTHQISLLAIWAPSTMQNHAVFDRNGTHMFACSIYIMWVRNNMNPCLHKRESELFDILNI